MLKGSEVKALQRGLRCLFKTGSGYRIQTPPMLFQGAVFGTVRSRYYMPGSAGSTSFSIPNKRTLTVWGHLDCICLV